MTAIVAVDFDWSIESCDKAPRDLDYERNTEKYGRAMKLTIIKRLNIPFLYKSRVMRKPTFCIYENKVADQLRSGSAPLFSLYR